MRYSKIVVWQMVVTADPFSLSPDVFFYTIIHSRIHVLVLSS